MSVPAASVPLDVIRNRVLPGHLALLRAAHEGTPPSAAIEPLIYQLTITLQRRWLATLRRWGCIDDNGAITERGLELLQSRGR